MTEATTAPFSGRIACFGEMLLRLTAPDRELLLQGATLQAHIGGAEANVAVALACLGHRSAMITALPDTELGDAAIGHLRRHGVDVSGVARATGRLGLYYLTPGAGLRASTILYDRADSVFAGMAPTAFDWPQLLNGADHLHLSGITPALGARSAEVAIAAATAADQAGITISFDGNYRAQLWETWPSDPRRILTELVGLADIFFGNHRDIALLLDCPAGGDGADDGRSAAAAAFAAFPKLQRIASTARHVVDADRNILSARVDTRDGCWQTGKVDLGGIVDRIGTGDAFAAGLLHGLRSGQDEGTALHTGLALACLKHSLPGDAALFSRRDLDGFWEQSRDVRR